MATSFAPRPDLKEALLPRAVVLRHQMHFRGKQSCWSKIIFTKTMSSLNLIPKEDPQENLMVKFSAKYNLEPSQDTELVLPFGFFFYTSGQFEL